MAKKAQSTNTVTAALEAFPASALLKSYEAEDRAVSAQFETRRKLMDGWIDGLRAAGVPKTEAGCAQIAFAITNNQDFIDAVAVGMPAAQVKAYAQSAQRAFFHGVEWRSDLAQKPELKLPWSKGAGGRPSAKGAGKTTAAAVAAPAAKPEPGAAIGAPADAETARLFIAGQLATLVAYGNKHMRILDLTTRDVLPALDKLSQTLKNIGKQA